MKKSVLLMVVALSVAHCEAALFKPKKLTKEQELLQASSEGDVTKVRQLLDEGVDVNTGRARGKATPLIIASEAGHVEVVKLLLERGADIFPRAGRHNLNALAYARGTRRLSLKPATKARYDEILKLLEEAEKKQK